MAINKRNWPKLTWQYPRVHDVTWGFGLSLDETMTTKQSTIVPYLIQDNAIVDYETIKTNPENEDFAVVGSPQCAAGSFVPKIMTSWTAYCPSPEPELFKFKYMGIHTAMLNRLDAFDKKTGNDIETILELTHETTDEQCFPLFNTVKLFEGHVVQDYPSDVPGLTAGQQPEGVAFDMEMYFDALHYYTNKEMLRSVTDRMQTYTLQPLVDSAPTKNKIKQFFGNVQRSMTKFAHPYTFNGGLFHLPRVATINQYGQYAATAIEHLTVLGRTRYNEFNPDFNFSRA